jgi:hypothetical protein
LGGHGGQAIKAGPDELQLFLAPIVVGDDKQASAPERSTRIWNYWTRSGSQVARVHHGVGSETTGDQLCRPTALPELPRPLAGCVAGGVQKAQL